MTGALQWAVLGADPVLDPNRPELPSTDLLGKGFGSAVSWIVAVLWGLLLVVAVIRLFASLIAVKDARSQGAADSLMDATKKLRTSIIALALLLCAAAVMGAYVALANHVVNAAGPLLPF